MERIITAAMLFCTLTAFAGNRCVDYSEKTLKVVVKGDGSMIDAALKEAVESNWNITSYDFCNYDGFKDIRTDTSFLFMMLYTDDCAEPATYLSVFQGGKESKGNGFSHPIFELPIASSGERISEAMPYITLYVKAFQNRIRDWSGTRAGIMPHSGKIDEMKRAKGRKIYLTEDDYSGNISGKELESIFGPEAVTVTRDQMDSLACTTENILIAKSLLIKNGKRSKSCNIIFDLRSGTIRFLKPVMLIFGRKKGFDKRELRFISYDH
ncbi:MAG: hypothetical protein LKK19_01770 [Bacteroidales bacterium]|nr:hypothetical protein [Bacteroidales bacterium]